MATAFKLAAVLTIAWLGFSASACGRARVAQVARLADQAAIAGSPAECRTCNADMSGAAGTPQPATTTTPPSTSPANTPATVSQPSVQPIAAASRDAGAPPGPSTPATPGAPGIGDEYFPDYGNGGYDVSHYDLQLRYTPTEDRLSGTATISLTPSTTLSRFNLDFLLDVSEVTVGGVKVEHAREGAHELVITPARPLPARQSVDVIVKYAGVPSEARVQGLRARPWWRTRDGAIGAGAPENAWWWYPSNDHPSDKATYTIAVTVPDGLTAISNGVQHPPPTAAEPGWTTWSWHSQSPQQTYVTLLVIGEYELVESKTPKGIPVTLAYTKRANTQNARASVDRTAEIVAWEESVFGPYPFEALGGVVSPSDGITYALETQTRPIYPINYFGSRTMGNTVLAHELAHQWFGDATAIARWRDVWLSEGFATYTEWLWSESQGLQTAQQIFDAAYARYAPGDAFWQIVVGDPGKERIFDQAVYQRGAMTLHQLRTTIGDDEFFEILRTWCSMRRFGNGSLEDFKALASAISGQDLDALFTTWLFTPGRPKLESAVRVSALELPALQTQTWHRPLRSPQQPASK